MPAGVSWRDSASQQGTFGLRNVSSQPRRCVQSDPSPVGRTHVFGQLVLLLGCSVSGSEKGAHGSKGFPMGPSYGPLFDSGEVGSMALFGSFHTVGVYWGPGEWGSGAAGKAGTV